MNSPPDSKISTNPTTFEFSDTQLLPKIPSNKPKRYPYFQLFLHRQIDTFAPEEEKDNNENFNPRRKQNLPAYLLPNIIPSQKKIHYYLANFISRFATRNSPFANCNPFSCRRSSLYEEEEEEERCVFASLHQMCVRFFPFVPYTLPMRSDLRGYKF
jgi:hypothetical protein